MGGDGLYGERCVTEELSDGTEAVLVEEVFVAHAGEHVYGAAQLTGIDPQAACYIARSLEVVTGHVDVQHGVEDAIVDLRHYKHL